MDVSTLEAGPELDDLIEQYVFGAGGDEIHVRRSPLRLLGSQLVQPIPAYSTNMADAWLVVEHLRDLWTTATEATTVENPEFTRPFDDGAFFDILHRHADRRWPWTFLYVTPLAICRAALCAVGAESS